MTFPENTLQLNQEKGGNRLKQGDFGSKLTFTLKDAQGNYFHELNSKTATITLCDDNHIVYESTTLVSDSSVTFNIEKAVQTGVFYLEIKIDNYIFPSDRSCLISIKAGAVAYDLKDLIPNYDVNMTIDGILSDLNRQGGSITDLLNKMASIYSNALADHAEIIQARGTHNTLNDRLINFADAITTNEKDILTKIDNKNNVIKLSHLSQEVKEALTGGSVAVVGKDGVSGIDNIIDGTVTPDNLIDHPLFIEKGVNLFNKATANYGFFVAYQDGKIYSTELDFYVSDFIKIEPNTSYAKNDGSGQQLAFYDSSKVFISGLSIGTTFTSPSNAAYIRLTVKSNYINTMMLVKGSVVGGYEPYTIKVKRAAIEEIKPLELEENSLLLTDTSKNLFDVEKALTGFYINYPDGKLYTQSLFSASDYIKVLPDTDYVKSDNQQLAFYDSNKAYISGLASATTFKTPTNAQYVRLSIPNTKVSNYQLEKGTIATAYEPFGALKIRRSDLAQLKTLSSANKPELLLPSKINIYKGMQFDIFFDGAIKNYQEFRHGNYYIAGQTIVNGVVSALKGNIISGKWFYRPTTNESFTIRFAIINTYTGDIVDSKDVAFTVTDKPVSGSPTIVTIGDSFMDLYGITKRISDLTDASGMTAKFIGLHDTGKTGVKDDTWAGWSWKSYATAPFDYKRTDRDDSGSTSTVNQFYNPSSKYFDFSYYMSTYQSNQNVDIVIINLGLNDVQQKTVDAVKTELAQSKKYVTDIINSIHAYDPNIKILLGTVPKQTSDNTFLGSYSTTYNHSERLNHNVEIFNEMLLEFESTSNVFISPLNLNFNSSESYLTKNIIVDQISEASVPMASDLHPNITGTEYIARTVYQAINTALT
ncbi:SGNH/GDSL hydrolase family protein [Streptococcus parauberis]|uniref:SGNH/GDSL hydrolase family protein n=1 Tax=Streptococcus parauberis TaxID=1348 RepID=UPI00020CBC05|nr:SGNH/GDSL hydrolase family protein [Streptococcus parauberis]AEF25707.1 Phage tail fiber [Streptococcus parauberis KCTC 11537]QBX17850.1 hypothetical protein Javan383_0005 [Streptococcus phage Javan383]QBX27340.1 tail fiber protein [Streptococcus phage Javan384]AEF25731.1 Phage tail fiber [Streptococcus parauberis KCTC 11537]UWM90174.1 SGNH/GDSL hydrolase family protein [Streptococcus parauberis]